MITPRIALAPLARPQFDLEFAQQVTRRLHRNLLAHGFEVIVAPQLITEIASAAAFAETLSQTQCDLLLLFQATFADSRMALHLVERLDLSLFLWALPEEPSGGRLRLNSLCGLNLTAHALTRRGRRYAYTYAPVDDASSFESLRSLAIADHVRRRLRKARFGLVGERPPGMDSCDLDERLLHRRLGVTIVPIPLEEVFERLRHPPQEPLKALRQTLEERLAGLPALDQEAVNRTLATYLILEEIAHAENLEGLAVRCWPEFFEQMGCAACGALSLLSNAHLPASCEADINGCITQTVLQWVSGEPAMGADIVHADYEKDEVALWHCGLAPLAMADPSTTPRATLHSNRRLPLLMEFPLKPGTITLARLSQATGGLQLVLSRAEMLPAPRPFSGTSGVMRPYRSAASFVDAILRNGLEHHLAFTYGDHFTTLTHLATLLEIPILTI